MAVISRIRKHSGWLVGLIGVSIAGFILQDAFSGRNQGGRIPKFAVIDGQEIKVQQFEEKVGLMTENYRLAQGDIPLTPEDMFQIRERVWMMMVGDVLLNETGRKLGLTVTAKEMNDMYYGQFIHPQVYRIFADPASGQINRQQVMMTINNFDQIPPESQKQLRDLEIVIKEDRQKNKYYEIIAGAYYVPTFYAKYMYEQANSSVAATVASLDYMDVPDEDVKLSDADYKAYYEKNKSLFKREDASRAIDYVIFDVEPTEQDLLDLDKHAHELYAEFLVEQNLPDFVNAVSTERFDSVYVRKDALRRPWDSILSKASEGTYFKPEIRFNRYEMAKLIDVATRPDSLRASHILITFKGSAASQQTQTRTKEQAKQVADSLKTVILRDKSKFAEIAKTSSEDGSKDNGGDLGWFADGQMVKPFNEAAVKGNIGDIIVVETVYGYHVIEITGKTRPVEKVMVAFVYVPIEPSAQTNKTVYTEVNQFFGKCKDLETFMEAAQEAKLHISKAEYVSEMDMQLPNLMDARDLVRWAYDKKTKVGHMASEIYEYENQYVVAALSQIREAGYPSLDELKTISEVQYAVRNEKKAEILTQKMNEVLKANKSIAALESINADMETIDQVAFNAYNIGGKGYEPEVIGALFGTKENQVSNPVKGRTGVFVVEPLHFTPAESLDNVDIIKNQLQMMFQQRMVQDIHTAAENKAKIKDNRAFYF